MENSSITLQRGAKPSQEHRHRCGRQTTGHVITLQTKKDKKPTTSNTDVSDEQSMKQMNRKCHLKTKAHRHRNRMTHKPKKIDRHAAMGLEHIHRPNWHQRRGLRGARYKTTWCTNKRLNWCQAQNTTLPYNKIKNHQNSAIRLTAQTIAVKEATEHHHGRHPNGNENKRRQLQRRKQTNP